MLACAAVAHAVGAARGVEVEGEIPTLARMSAFAEAGTDGRFAFLEMERGKKCGVELRGDEVFEPASAIKVLIHLHAMWMVQRGDASLDEAVPVATRLAGSCPVEGEFRAVPMREALRAMMQDSDNAATAGLRERFGDEAIQETASVFGLWSTALRHRIGCGEDAYARPNATTLRDLVRAYEVLLSDAFSAEVRGVALSLMRTSSGEALPEPLRIMAAQEKEAAGLSDEDVRAFEAGTVAVLKGGNYDWRVGEREYHDQSRAGAVVLPFKTRSGEIVSRCFLAGAYVNDASDEGGANVTATTLYWECFRHPLRRAMRSWAAGLARKAADVDDGSGEGVPDGEVDVGDLRYFLDRFVVGDLAADVDDGSGAGRPDGVVGIDDLLYFLDRFAGSR